MRSGYDKMMPERENATFIVNEFMVIFSPMKITSELIK